MKTKIKPKNRIKTKTASGHSPSPSTNGKSRPSSTSSAKPATAKSPPASGSTPPSPFAETQTPNGSKAGGKYYRYLFHPDSEIGPVDGDAKDLGYLASCAKDLASKSFPNYGEAYMGVYAKFLGVRNVEQIDFRWRTNTFHLDLIITLAGQPPVTIGRLEPSSDEWYVVNPDGTRTETKPVVQKLPPRPIDPALLKATEKKADEFTAADLPKPKPKRTVLACVETDKATGKQTIFGKAPTAVMRWCGYDAWLFIDVCHLFIGLGLGESIKRETVEKQMSYGRKGPKGSPKPIPEFGPEQEDALLKLAEQTKLKHAPAGRTKKKK